jgi:RimJ/RimL family protein N-acetyltransferase
MSPNAATPSHFVPSSGSVGARDPGPQSVIRKYSDCHLSPFAAPFAPLVASWIRTTQELIWLAPGTVPPLTAEKVALWGDERRNRFLFWDGAGGMGVSPVNGREGRATDPSGYGELNEIPDQPAQFWIGHFVIDPGRRGQSLGVRFAQALLARAFVEYAAKEVVLVVFPDNQRAISCYERAGMQLVGQERKYFKATGAEHLFLRMSISRRRFERLAANGRIEGRPLVLRNPDS